MGEEVALGKHIIQVKASRISVSSGELFLPQAS